jgi:hypothetical protein
MDRPSSDYPFSRPVEQELRQLAREEASAVVQKSLWTVLGLAALVALLFWLA